MENTSRNVRKNGWLPLFDFAYQGLANGLEEDAVGLRTFAEIIKNY